jgi:hypothetical protein
MDVKSKFFEKGRFMVQDGTQTRFWEDLWVGNESLMKSFPSLYNIARKKNVTVAQVLSTVPLNISFRRVVVGENWVEWLKLVGEKTLLFGIEARLSPCELCTMIL